MTRVVISQPMYFPWAGFMAQMALADVYIWLDDVQYSKRSFTSRIQVKTAGERCWMSIPVVSKGRYDQRIIDLEPSNDTWEKSHRVLLSQVLSRYPHKLDALSLFDQTMALEGSLCDRLIASAESQANHLGILPPRVYRSSEMGCKTTSSERLFELVQAVSGTDYITGHGAWAYLNHSLFNDANISVSYMRYDPLPWPQPHGDFTPYVTGLDLIAAVPRDQAKDHLRPATVDWRAFTPG
ncbi:WbqC family protein [Allorhizobium terrae]|uniref:WbqC family protein n=1 Tax=Allorhizobium terrae TaxID=1848972 RepID=A0A4S3ZY24_9HYPH|nr:WbqC family protein [Allorhizobium terrae]THF50739.1 hypothetical protein E6C51_07740 [Allorhizobium terrae]TWD55501.1 WbqC-like protein [Agrobacterium vitis]